MRKNIGVFRGKRKDNGEWIEGFFTCATDCCGRSYFIDVPRKDPDDSNHRYEVDSETVGEFTGLTDKNGTRIFEGDILSSDIYPYTSDGNQNYFAEVLWFDDCPAFGLYIFKSPKSLVRGVAEQSTSIDDDLSDMEVIGNIHDNPELLGGAK